jgi:hypothetical protein
MSLVVLRERRDIYDMILRGRSSLFREHPVHISVRAPHLPDQDRQNLQLEIQTAVDQSLRRADSIQLRENKKPPSDRRVRRMISAQFGSAPPKKSRRRASSKDRVRVTMSGLSLPKQDLRSVQSEVRQLVLERVGTGSDRRARAEILVCVCGWPFGGWCDRPGTTIDLTQIDPLPPSSGDPRTTPIQIGICESEDVLTMGIWDPDPRDPAEQNMTQDQILVGLRIDDALMLSTAPWAKEIQGWTTCLGGVETVHQDSVSVGFNWMFISKDTVETLVFRKAKFLGVMTDMYSFEPVEFWKLLGGHILTFDWLCDACQCG